MTPPRIVVAIPDSTRRRLFTEQAWARLQRCGDLAVNPAGGELAAPAAAAVLSRADILVTGWGTSRGGRPLPELAPRLTTLVHTAGTVHTLVDDGDLRRGLAVSSQAAANGRPVAEYTLAMILLAGKNIPAVHRAYRNRRGPVDTDRLLDGRGNHRPAVGIIGASTIGRDLLRLLTPFDIEPRLHDPLLTTRQIERLGARPASLKELMAASAVVTLHAPLRDTTRGMITAELLALLPDGATFINTARGALVDQRALEAELTGGRISAVLDVTDPEVPPAGSPLWDLPNLLLTPHIAGSMGTEVRRLGDGAVREVERCTRGEPLHHGVSRARLATMA